MKKLLTITLKLIINIILMPLRLVWSLTWIRYRKPIIQDLKQAKSHEIVFVLVVLCGLLFIALNGDAQAHQTLTFKLDPPVEYDWTLEKVDMDKLAMAVALQETGYCTSKGSPTANSRNNCWGIMGRNGLKAYKTKEEGKADFIRIWNTYYGGIPTYKQAKRYSGNDKAEAWYYNVLFAYDNL